MKSGKMSVASYCLRESQHSSWNFVVTNDYYPAGERLSEVPDAVYYQFGIDHVMIQIEPEGFGECAGGCPA